MKKLKRLQELGKKKEKFIREENIPRVAHISTVKWKASLPWLSLII